MRHREDCLNLAALALAAAVVAPAASVRSPDGEVAAEFFVKDGCAVRLAPARRADN